MRVRALEQNADLLTGARKGDGCLGCAGGRGTQARGPGLFNLRESSRAGDDLVAWKLDRLGRNIRHLPELVDGLQSRSPHVGALGEGFAVTGSMGKVMRSIMPAFAQLEPGQLAERTRAGQLAVTPERPRPWRPGPPRAAPRPARQRL